MCGICGIFDFRGAPVDEGILAAMTSVMQHRGPDGHAVHVAGRIGLGHRRLSIIDLAGGAQPISNEDGTLHVVFNGEIYNFVELRSELEGYGHLFKTRSDTEVIVHGYEQWGLECLSRFNGIFAFALWDQKNQSLLLARDHFGVKPLYYAQVGNQLAFASEIKSVMQHPGYQASVDLRSLSLLFTLRYVPSPDTIFDGIKKLPPAHLMIVDNKGIQTKRYWNWTPRTRTKWNRVDLIAEYQSLLEDAVRLQMRSDVPVGLFLSSGIDSGTLLALMSERTSEPIRTFTIGFAEGDRSNETDDARAMANMFGAKHRDMIVGPSDYERYYDRYMMDIEEPVGNETAAAFYFVSAIASQEVKVALTGQGADEPWAGYHRHLGMRLSDLYSKLPTVLTDRLLLPLVKRCVSNERLRRGASSLSETDSLSRLVKIYSFYSSEMKDGLFRDWVKREVSIDGTEAKETLRERLDDVATCDSLTQILYIDTRTNLPDDLLMVGDKTSMANSLEARVPFLDYRIVEFIESLPPSLRLHGLTPKFLHKLAIQKWLPKTIVNRKKKGFANPINEWLRGSMKTYIADRLLSDDAAVNKYFNKEYIHQIVRDHDTGKQQHLRHIYLLLSFELWHNTFISNGIRRSTASFAGV